MSNSARNSIKDSVGNGSCRQQRRTSAPSPYIITFYLLFVRKPVKQIQVGHFYFYYFFSSKGLLDVGVEEKGHEEVARILYNDETAGPSGVGQLAWDSDDQENNSGMIF